MRVSGASLTEIVYTRLRSGIAPGEHAHGHGVKTLAPLARQIEELPEGTLTLQDPDIDAGVGVRAGTSILTEAGADSTFPTICYLAAYAGLAPAARSSGGEQPYRRRNKQPKRAFFLSEFAARAGPTSLLY
ncbi:transposase [Streptomyces sp. NPDC060005]|uniref:transposase n=1 Tax=Streptomyces sp. NPDC060005 TaxID=3347034 RepID=UPI0036C7D3E9